MITPVEVLGKELKRGCGYKAVEVDEFLEELEKDSENDYRKQRTARESICIDRELKPLPHDRRILKESIGSCGRDIQRDN